MYILEFETVMGTKFSLCIFREIEVIFLFLKSLSILKFYFMRYIHTSTMHACTSLNIFKAGLTTVPTLSLFAEADSIVFWRRLFDFPALSRATVWLPARWKSNALECQRWSLGTPSALCPAWDAGITPALVFENDRKKFYLCNTSFSVRLRGKLEVNMYRSAPFFRHHMSHILHNLW